MAALGKKHNVLPTLDIVTSSQSSLPLLGYVFCFLHRLPEQHGCVYDHKEGGRQEALKTMVPASRKKFGRSFHRMDSRPEQ